MGVEICSIIKESNAWMCDMCAVNLLNSTNILKR